MNEISRPRPTVEGFAEGLEHEFADLLLQALDLLVLERLVVPRPRTHSADGSHRVATILA
jgi:hypothetical protein